MVVVARVVGATVSGGAGRVVVVVVARVVGATVSGGGALVVVVARVVGAAVVAGCVACVAWLTATATATAPPVFAAVVVGAAALADVVGGAVVGFVAFVAAVVADLVVGAAVLVAVAVVAVGGFVVPAAAATQTRRLFTFVQRSFAPLAVAVFPTAAHTPPALATLVLAFTTFGFDAALAMLVACHPMAATTVVASRVRVTIRFVISP